MKHKLFTEQILDWYDKNKRDLPWRRTRDPFKIWLSEVIMQQTRVNQGLPYYQKFDERFDTVKDLAVASEEEVLQMWQGLGYYSRGRNLLAGAKAIVEDFNGSMPGNYQDLLSIKGIGTYTAAAVASIAYGEPVACIDGNVYRVLSRVFGVEEDLAYAEGQKKIRMLAEKLVHPQNPGDYNQAVMEFGAMQCTPKNPDCPSCIFFDSCFARINQKQNVLPFKSKKVKKKDRYIDYVLFTFEDQYLMRHRNHKDIWHGLYDFHSLSENNHLLNEEELMRELGKLNSNLIFRSARDYRHILSHQNLYARISRVEMETEKDLQSVLATTQLSKFSLKEVESLPKPVLINKYLNDEIF